MCPFCIANAALLLTGVISTGGLSTVVVNKFRGRNAAESTSQNTQKGSMDHEQESDGVSESRLAI
jgi:hypothetical protein